MLPNKVMGACEEQTAALSLAVHAPPPAERLHSEDDMTKSNQRQALCESRLRAVKRVVVTARANIHR